MIGFPLCSFWNSSINHPQDEILFQPSLCWTLGARSDQYKWSNKYNRLSSTWSDKYKWSDIYNWLTSSWSDKYNRLSSTWSDTWSDEYNQLRLGQDQNQ